MEQEPRSFAQARRQRMAIRDSLSELEDRLAAAAASTGWHDDVIAAYRQLREAFQAHVTEVEGSDGILADLVEAAPRVANTVALLQAEHVTITERIDALIEKIPTHPPEGVREESLELMRALVLHRQRGSDLVYEAYSTDLGGQSGS
jgi:hypothetical protein